MWRLSIGTSAPPYIDTTTVPSAKPGMNWITSAGRSMGGVPGAVAGSLTSTITADANEIGGGAVLCGAEKNRKEIFPVADPSAAAPPGRFAGSITKGIEADPPAGIVTESIPGMIHGESETTSALSGTVDGF